MEEGDIATDLVRATSPSLGLMSNMVVISWEDKSPSLFIVLWHSPTVLPPSLLSPAATSLTVLPQRLWSKAQAQFLTLKCCISTAINSRMTVLQPPLDAKRQKVCEHGRASLVEVPPHVVLDSIKTSSAFSPFQSPLQTVSI